MAPLMSILGRGHRAGRAGSGGTLRVVDPDSGLIVEGREIDGMPARERGSAILLLELRLQVERIWPSGVRFLSNPTYPLGSAELSVRTDRLRTENVEMRSASRASSTVGEASKRWRKRGT